MSYESSLLVTKTRATLWHFGTIFWIVGILDLSFKFLADGALSVPEFVKLLLMFSLCIVWSYLKSGNLKTKNPAAENISTLKYYQIDSGAPQHEAYRHKTEARMLQLDQHHLITQEYILPIPYLCQIYHLLNLKHLESVHSFSLSHLKVTDISHFKPTASGGTIKFTTILNSSFNMLKVFRRPTVEVELTLHTPYTIELSIPVYGGKKVVIIFNVLPLSSQEHKLFIDIYSDLMFPRPILQTLCHFASSLTLLEDLPYLHRLARANTQNFGKIGRSNRKMMLLFDRFVELYGSSLREPPSLGAIELLPISGSPA